MSLQAQLQVKICSCNIKPQKKGSSHLPLAIQTKAFMRLPYSLNISREKTFIDFTDLRVTSKILTLKILSCITILCYVFAIREIFITKILKAMNPRKF